jgi:predicted ester cyclase
MAVDIKQSSRRLLEEAFGKGNLDVFDEICDPSCRAHDPLMGDLDLRSAKENCRTYTAAFPDLKPTILTVVRDGDTCVIHWRMTGTHQKELMGLPPMGARCTVEGITVDRYRGARIVESWTRWDALGLMRQLGVSVPLGAASAAATARRQTHV